MPVSVSINPHTRERFFSTVFDKSPNLERQLLSDFKVYKASRREKLPAYFGKDVPYIKPYAAEKVGLMHIHFCIPPDKFNESLPQSDRVCRKGNPDKDICLVYVQSEIDENVYSLLAILGPDAHEQARKLEIMNYLCRIAQDFIDKN